MKRRTKTAQVLGAAGLLSIIGPAAASAAIPAASYSQPNGRHIEMLADEQLPAANLGTFYTQTQDEEIEGPIAPSLRGLYNKAGGGAVGVQGNVSIAERFINSHGA
jgi:hypothetical protein